MNMVMCGPVRWDSFSSQCSNPLRDLADMAPPLPPVRRIEIPRIVWGVLQRHPKVMELRKQYTESNGVVCAACGRGETPPPLDSKEFGRLINCNIDGPIWPDAVVIVELDSNTVTLFGSDVVTMECVLDFTNTSAYGDRLNACL